MAVLVGSATTHSASSLIDGSATVRARGADVTVGTATIRSTAGGSRDITITVTAGTDRWAVITAPDPWTITIASDTDRWAITSDSDRWAVTPGTDQWNVTTQGAP